MQRSAEGEIQLSLAKRRKLSRIKMSQESQRARGTPPPYTTSPEHAGRQLTQTAGRTSRGQASPQISTSDRDELMECIKRGQKPKWVPKPGFEALRVQEEAALKQRQLKLAVDRDGVQDDGDKGEDQVEDLQSGEVNQWRKSWAQSETPIERPRSAFHAGDFYDDGSSIHMTSSPFERQSNAHSSSLSPLGASPPPWSLEIARTASLRASTSRIQTSFDSMSGTSRRRAPSLGSSYSSFVMRTPTSPLVQATNNPSLDFSARPIAETESPEVDNVRQRRRQTLPPNSFATETMSPVEMMPNFSRPLPTPPLRREQSLPDKTHQSRRSLTSFTYHPSPSTPFPRSRRPSFASESSPRRKTSMVGSFEESILRGRMSSPASKPFEFVAQIGVMGKGNCPASLKCPAHVTVAFQAVFYNYPSTQVARTIADDAPSPYVGSVDLEHNLKPVHLGPKRKPSVTDQGEYVAAGVDETTAPENTRMGKALVRDAKDSRPQPASPRISIGGAYRVPQQGQIQIIIKNSNKTAVKLFLVPYDLDGMETGTRTFVRQRSYSSGSITEVALAQNPQILETSDTLKDKSILRYLIHLRFCCPAKGKFYLYDNIRVVFANRVPDGKEKLRNEIQIAEPKYMPFKPSERSLRSRQSSMTDTSPFDALSRFDSSPGLLDRLTAARLADAPAIPEEMPDLNLGMPYTAGSSTLMTSPGPTSDFPRLPPEPARRAFPERALSPVQGFRPSTSQRSSPVPWVSHSSPTASHRSFSPTPAEAGDSLLSRQFRSLREATEPAKSSGAGGDQATEASIAAADPGGLPAEYLSMYHSSPMDEEDQTDRNG